MLLPVGDGAAPQPAPVSQAETDPPAQLRGTVLVVDDEEHVLNVAETFCQLRTLKPNLKVILIQRTQ